MVATEAPPAVVVTGASTGIGRGVSLRLARSGLLVFPTVRKPGDAAGLLEAFPDRVKPLLLDVTDAASVAEAGRAVREHLQGRGLAGLVNNAGVVVGGPLECLPLEQFWHQLEVNLIGPLALCQEFLPLLRQAGGRVVNVGSISGRALLPYMGAYSASKFALRALTDSLRMELRPWRVRVCLIEPGNVRTPIWDKSVAWSRRLQEAHQPDAAPSYQRQLAALWARAERMGRKGLPPEAVAAAVLHALTAPRPQDCYRLGLDAWAAYFLQSLLPDRVFEWLLQRYFGIPSPHDAEVVRARDVCYPSPPRPPGAPAPGQYYRVPPRPPRLPDALRPQPRRLRRLPPRPPAGPSRQPAGGRRAGPGQRERQLHQALRLAQ